MEKDSPTARQGFLKILKESTALYFKNILCFMEIAVWISLPASIFFVLMFYWGLPPRVLDLLIDFSYPAAFFLLLVVNAAAIKAVQAMEEGAKIRAVNAYASAVDVFPSYLQVFWLMLLKILVWAAPFWVFYAISFWINPSPSQAMWLAGLAFVTLVPVFAAMFFYCFSLMAFLVNGKKASAALMESKRIIKGNVWRLVRYLPLFLFLMMPFYRLVSWGKEELVSIPLSSSALFLVLLWNSSLNFLLTMVNVFVMVFFYFLYKEFRNQPYLKEASL